MSDDLNESWPPQGHRIASSEHLKALGEITLAYNYFEETIGLLFTRTMPTEEAFSARLYQRMNNRDRIDLLSAIVSAASIDEEIKDGLKYVILCYDICTDNRNILSHAILESSDADIIELSKKAARDPTRLTQFKVPLEDLRRFAEDTGNCFTYALRLSLTISARAAPQDARGSIPDWHFSLPSKPQKPSKLTPHLPPAGQ